MSYDREQMVMKFGGHQMSVFQPIGVGGEAYRIAFKNWYEASVVRNPFSYGSEEGLWELAVMDVNGIVYDTPITSDVEGWLTESDVDDLLTRIEKLPSRSEGKMV